MEEREDSEFLLDGAYRHPSGNIHQAGRYMSLELRDVWAGGVTSGQQRTEAMSVHEITGDSGEGAAAPGPGLEEGTRREARPGGDRNRGARKSAASAGSPPQMDTNLPEPGRREPCGFALNSSNGAQFPLSLLLVIGTLK